ncbi:MAG: threonylcarbamoyl-AMP synthase [Marinilabiliaceae bacterium]|nr:threonylcarbamoyl-AMP synthase [Marinilabiliaceae bacterium]
MKQDIDNALDVLHKGGIILYPTDTIWGIGCDATNGDAVKRIYDLKRRIDSKSMLILLDNAARLASYVDTVPDVAYDLIDLSDKPMTIIYDGAKNLAKNLIAEDGSVGIRITSEPFSKTLCQRFKKPIVSTSANISGEPSPRNFSEISEIIKKGVDYVVMHRQNETKQATPSGIIKLGASGEVKIIRP